MLNVTESEAHQDTTVAAGDIFAAFDTSDLLVKVDLMSIQSSFKMSD